MGKKRRHVLWLLWLRGVGNWSI